MHFPESTPAGGWREQPVLPRDADALSPSLTQRRWHAGLLVATVAAVAATAGWRALDDPRPLDVQLSTAMRDASATLHDWQGQLSRGLQVSLRAVADGRETASVDTAMLADAPPAAGMDGAATTPQPELPPAQAQAASQH